MDLIQKVKKTIKKYAMVSEGDHVLIGLSGGPDSVCLAVVMDRLRKDLDLDLSAVYIDHGLRPGETGDDAGFCRKLCDDLQVDFFSEAVNVEKYAEDKGLNKQEAARVLRYKMFDEIAQKTGAARIAVGHTADDQAETVLMRLLRGSGRKGLSGIPPVRNNIVRPLIEVTKKEIEVFLNNAGAVHALPLRYIVDSSNLKKDYFRNWIRLTFMEEIKDRNPSAVQDICRTAEILREEDDYLELVVTKTLMRLISRKSDNSIEIFLTPLRTIEKPVLRRVLRRAISATKGLRGIDFVHIEDIIRLVKEGKSGGMLNLPGGIRVVKDYSLLKITTEKPAAISGYGLQPPGEVEIREADVIIKALIEEKPAERVNERTEVILDAGTMSLPLRIRQRAEGDFFYPLGFGKRKKLQDFFVDEKIPKDERDRVPIVLSGNDIIWVAGYRADDRFRVTERTEKYLRLIISDKK